MNNLINCISSYSSLITAFAGLFTAISFSVVGYWIMKKFISEMPPFFLSLPVSTLLGMHVFSLATQIMSFHGIARTNSLRSLFFLQMALSVALIFSLPNKSRGIAEAKKFFFASAKNISFIFLIALITSTFVISVAPSTKIDELFYHMLTPVRVIQEGGFSYFNFPFEAMLPHMHLQIAASSLYALGLPDAFNVVNWYMGVIFALFCLSVIYRKTKNLNWSLFITLGMYAGMYAPVWFVSGGVGASSLLSMTVLSWITLTSNDPLYSQRPQRTLLMASFLSMSLSASKLSYLPFAIACLFFISYSIWRRNKYKKHFTFFVLRGVPGLFSIYRCLSGLGSNRDIPLE